MELTRQPGALVQRHLRFLRAIEGDPDHSERPGIGREPLGRDRNRGGRAVQKALAGAAGKHAAEVTAVGRAHDHQVGLRLLAQDVEPVRGRVTQNRLKREPVGVDLIARLGKGLAGRIRQDRLKLLGPAGSRGRITRSRRSRHRLPPAAGLPVRAHPSLARFRRIPRRSCGTRRLLPSPRNYGVAPSRPTIGERPQR